MTADLQFVVEAVREGYLLHYDDSRLLQDNDQDLALLTGDQYYAAGLSRLAEHGDLANIRVLAGLIAGGARAHAEGDSAAAERLWEPLLAGLEPSST